MTPERLQEMRANAFKYRETAGYLVEPDEMVSVFEYIDVIHEDLRITRAERDAEKKKRAQEAKDHAAEVLAWDALAVDARAKAWDEGYEEGRSDGWHDTRDNTPNPYRKDTK